MRKPTHLAQSAYSKYEELLALVKGKMRDGDENLLAVLANAYSDYKVYHKELIDRGPVFGGKTMTRANPAHNMVKDTVKTIEMLSSHFGLSPKSRGEKLDKKEVKADALDQI